MTDDEFKALLDGSSAQAFLEAEQRSREEARTRDGPVWYDVKQGLGVIFALAVFGVAAVLLLWSFVVVLPTLIYVAIQGAITIAVVAAVIATWNAVRRVK